MRHATILGAALVAAFVGTEEAEACPCQGTSGPLGAVTSQGERFGVSLTETARVVHGAWRSNGDYSALAPGSQQRSLDLTLVAGYRPIPVIELGAQAAVGRQSASSPAYGSSQTGFGDTTFRARWDVLDEPMPFEKPLLPWPSVTLVAGARAPTASLGRDDSGAFSGTSGSVGSSASSEGLGAWETSASVALARSVSMRWQLGLTGEAAYRFPDTSLGLERHLAPRLFAQLGARYTPSPSVGFGLLTDLTAEGNVTLEGLERPATSQRLWTVSAYGFVRVRDTGLRWGLLVRHAPPIEGIDRNAVRTTSLAVSLGYVMR